MWPFSLRKNGNCIALVAIIAIAAPCCFAQVVTGKVVGTDGTPLANVEVYGTKEKCCPVSVKSTRSKADGSFRIANPGPVLHLRRNDTQPTSILVNGKRPVRIVINNQQPEKWNIPRCGTSSEHRSGWNYLFLPKSNSELHKGRDVDYERFGMQGQEGGTLESWFGPTAASVDAFEEYYTKSKWLSERFVIVPPIGIVGIDARGVYRDGKKWRWLGLDYAIGTDRKSLLGVDEFWHWPRMGATDMISYSNATEREAEEFDRIIDSVCLKSRNDETQRVPFPFVPKGLRE